MTDEGILAIKEDLGFDSCPECGHRSFTLTTSQTLEKRVDLEYGSASGWTETHGPYCVRSVTVKCRSCGETWDTEI